MFREGGPNLAQQVITKLGGEEAIKSSPTFSPDHHPVVPQDAQQAFDRLTRSSLEAGVKRSGMPKLTILLQQPQESILTPPGPALTDRNSPH